MSTDAIEGKTHMTDNIMVHSWNKKRYLSIYLMQIFKYKVIALGYLFKCLDSADSRVVFQPQLQAGSALLLACQNNCH